MRPPLLPVLILALTAVSALPALGQTAARPGAARPAAGGIEWRALSAEQKSALTPLATLWPTLNLDQQRKWIALAKNFNRMSEGEQATLQERMADWAQLTPAQRTEARLNFGEVRRRIPADEKKAKWEEYQALPAEERERLANDRPRPPVGAAPALRPTPTEWIVRPLAPSRATANATPPSVLRPIGPVNRNTLLPQAPAARPND